MNIKEVAKLAKVSTATVSRTINGSDKVSARTAERVQKAIKQLNFYPNTHARTLVSGRSRMIGLIISDITNPFFPELVKHLRIKPFKGLRSNHCEHGLQTKAHGGMRAPHAGAQSGRRCYHDFRS